MTYILECVAWALLGLSMGGYIGFVLAQTFPRRCKRVKGCIRDCRHGGPCITFLNKELE